jgi:hypothetical protein
MEKTYKTETHAHTKEKPYSRKSTIQRTNNTPMLGEGEKHEEKQTLKGNL